MDRVDSSGYDDFWQSPTALQKLELERANQKQRDAQAWQRNMVGVLIITMLVVGCFCFLR